MSGINGWSCFNASIKIIWILAIIEVFRLLWMKTWKPISHCNWYTYLTVFAYRMISMNFFDFSVQVADYWFIGCFVLNLFWLFYCFVVYFIHKVTSDYCTYFDSRSILLYLLNRTILCLIFYNEKNAWNSLAMWMFQLKTFVFFLALCY